MHVNKKTYIIFPCIKLQHFFPPSNTLTITIPLVPQLQPYTAAFNPQIFFEFLLNHIAQHLHIFQSKTMHITYIYVRSVFKDVGGTCDCYRRDCNWIRRCEFDEPKEHSSMCPITTPTTTTMTPTTNFLVITIAIKLRDRGGRRRGFYRGKTPAMLRVLF